MGVRRAQSPPPCPQEPRRHWPPLLCDVDGWGGQMDKWRKGGQVDDKWRGGWRDEGVGGG